MLSARFLVFALLVLAIPLVAIPTALFSAASARIEGYEATSGRVIGHQCHADRKSRTLCRAVVAYTGFDGRPYTLVSESARSGREALGAPVDLLASPIVPGEAVRSDVLELWGATVISALICGALLALLVFELVRTRRSGHRPARTWLMRKLNQTVAPRR